MKQSKLLKLAELAFWIIGFIAICLAMYGLKDKIDLNAANLGVWDSYLIPAEAWIGLALVQYIVRWVMRNTSIWFINPAKITTLRSWAAHGKIDGVFLRRGSLTSSDQPDDPYSDDSGAEAKTVEAIFETCDVIRYPGTSRPGYAPGMGGLDAIAGENVIIHPTSHRNALNGFVYCCSQLRLHNKTNMSDITPHKLKWLSIHFPSVLDTGENGGDVMDGSRQDYENFARRDDERWIIGNSARLEQDDLTICTLNREINKYREEHGLSWAQVEAAQQKTLKELVPDD